MTREGDKAVISVRPLLTERILANLSVRQDTREQFPKAFGVPVPALFLFETDAFQHFFRGPDLPHRLQEAGVGGFVTRTNLFDMKFEMLLESELRMGRRGVSHSAEGVRRRWVRTRCVVRRSLGRSGDRKVARKRQGEPDCEDDQQDRHPESGWWSHALTFNTPWRGFQGGRPRSPRCFVRRARRRPPRRSFGTFSGRREAGYRERFGSPRPQSGASWRSLPPIS